MKSADVTSASVPSALQKHTIELGSFLIPHFLPYFQTEGAYAGHSALTYWNEERFGPSLHGVRTRRCAGWRIRQSHSPGRHCSYAGKSIVYGQFWAKLSISR